MIEGMTFGEALELLKEGQRVQRIGWKGKDMFLYLVRGTQFEVNRAPLDGIYPKGTMVRYLPHIDMRTADGDHVPWLASQSDILGDDWQIFKSEFEAYEGYEPLNVAE